MNLKKKLPVTIFTERDVTVGDLKGLFPKMKRLHLKSEKMGKELGTNIRYKKDKLSLKQGWFFIKPFKGESDVVDIEFAEDSIGTFHTHPFDIPILSIGDVCDNFVTGKYKNIDCVSGSNPFEVACYRLKINKDGSIPQEVKKIRKLCLEKGEDVETWRYYWRNRDKVVEKIIGEKWDR